MRDSLFGRRYIAMSKDIINIIENSKVTHPLVLAAKDDNRYWSDFLQVVGDYRNLLNKSEYNRFLHKSQLDRPISKEQYLQFASEITVVDYIIRNHSNFKYEPKYNSQKNPECSFDYEGRTINIEVKCPDFSSRIQQEKADGIKVFAAERFPDKDQYTEALKVINDQIQDSHIIKSIDRLDNKLKDYLLSAQLKFPTSGLSNFNILVIAVDTIGDMDEWYSYLFGDNGAFTSKTYIDCDYSNVDAVLLTNVQHGHMGYNVNLSINCWKLENYVSLLFLDPRKQNINGLSEYYEKSALNLFGGQTRNFLSFQNKLDEEINLRNRKIKECNLDERKREKLFDKFYLEDKITSLQIISEWIKVLKNRG